jgi:hypothetical protein
MTLTWNWGPRQAIGVNFPVETIFMEPIQLFDPQGTLIYAYRNT